MKTQHVLPGGFMMAFFSPFSCGNQPGEEAQLEIAEHGIKG